MLDSNLLGNRVVGGDYQLGTLGDYGNTWIAMDAVQNLLWRICSSSLLLVCLLVYLVFLEHFHSVFTFCSFRYSFVEKCCLAEHNLLLYFLITLVHFSWKTKCFHHIHKYNYLCFLIFSVQCLYFHYFFLFLCIRLNVFQSSTTYVSLNSFRFSFNYGPTSSLSF